MIHDMIMAAAGATGPVEPTDADFENTVLLLHGDGTNGAQNNTFIDSSTNNFTITRNGNTTQGTFTPFSKPDGRWGNFFDGTNDNLSVAANSAFLYTGDFTVELWVYPTRFVDFEFLFGTGGSGTQDQANIYANGTYVYFDGTNSVTSPALQLNAWNHIAVTRSGTTIRAYANGVSGNSETKSGNLGSSANAFRIGERSDGAQDFNGYISNLRVVNGTAVYTGATYTVPTAPLTAITNTSLLTCQSNRFKDNSSNNFAITANGDVRVTPFSPFPITTAYSTSVNGGAGYFDGSGDYLSIADNAAFEFGSGDFCVEFFAYVIATGVNGILFVSQWNDPNRAWVWAYVNSGTTLNFDYSTTGSNIVSVSSSVTLPINQWAHFAACRSGNTLSTYMNGTRVATASVTGVTIYAPNQALEIGRNPENTTNWNMNGYISGLRIVKGSSVYDPTQTTITVPTAPPTAISNTSVLTNFTNAGIFDNTGFNALETVGNAQIDTTTKKYGTGSMEFDGNGDYCIAPSSPNLALGSGDFTIEAWVNVTAHTNADGAICLNWTGTWSANNWSLHSDHGSANEKFSFWANNYSTSVPMLTSTTTVATGTWYHVAVTRSGSSWRLFVNGTQEGSTVTSSAALDNGASWPIYLSGAIAGQVLNGYIDDLRITKGIARYTSNFTPPTAALPDIGA